MEEKQNTFFYKFRQEDNISLKHRILALNGKVIEWTTSIKFLGIVENKVSKNTGILHKAKNIFSKGGLETLYFSFVNSYLNFGNIAWGSTTRTKLKKNHKQTKTGY